MTNHLEALWIERNVVETMQDDTIEQLVHSPDPITTRSLARHLMFLTVRHEYINRMIEIESAHQPPKTWVRKMVERYNL